ncbi:hypothetical protein FQA39_LY16884 [Lamprigera yunnana]|nr:hypothetical protein FQA39_LY16884 [Lamprigera yunnana]
MEKNNLDVNKWMIFLPQVFAAVVATSLQSVVGQILSYSGILIPQLLEEQKYTNGSDIIVTKVNSAWIASAPVFSCLIVSVPAGMLVDHIGRLKTIMLSSIPGVIGHALIATATSMSVIIWGRIITGICFVLISNPVAVYISEISSPNLRGSFLGIMQVNFSIGMVLVYLQGWIMHWRTVAWLTNLFIAVPIILMFFFLPESPAWLVSKGRTEQARNSLAWFYRYYPPNSNIVEEKLVDILRDQQRKQINLKFKWKEHIKLFFLPTFYKPFLMLMVLYFFQQNSGIFIIVFNSVIFFKDIGSNIDPYVASVYLSGIKVTTSVIAIWLMNKFNRRTLLMISSVGMAVSMIISGLNTQWIQADTSNHEWVPLVGLLLYILFSCLGVAPMAFILTGELFPLKIRGISYSLVMSYVNIISFFVLQTYLPLLHLLGGSANLQYYFAIMAIAVAVVVYLFLPETHNFKLIEIEQHFKRHTLYLASRYADEARASRVSDNLL